MYARLIQVKGLDPNPGNLVAAAKFCCVTAPQGLPVMVRLETHAASGQVRSLPRA